MFFSGCNNNKNHYFNMYIQSKLNAQEYQMQINIKKINEIREDLKNSDDKYLSDVVANLPEQQLLKLVTMATVRANQTKQ